MHQKLEEEMGNPIKVIDFVKKKARFHSNMEYDLSRKGFILEPFPYLTPGIYFILLGDDIHKIGKADGKHGLKGRINNYRANVATRMKTDFTTQRYFNVMTGLLKNKVLQMYIYECPSVKQEIEGYTLELQMARSFEETLTRQAIDERHTMSLSGQI